MVMVGLSEVSGSWKIMPTSLPRTLHISFSDSGATSRPRRRTESGGDVADVGQEPHDGQAGGGLAAAGLAHDSDALALVTSKETPSTATTGPVRIRNSVWRFSSCRTGVRISEV